MLLKFTGILKFVENFREFSKNSQNSHSRSSVIYGRSVTLTTPELCIEMQLSGSRESWCSARAVDRCTTGSWDARYSTSGRTDPSLPNSTRLFPQQQQRAIASANCRRSSSSVCERHNHASSDSLGAGASTPYKRWSKCTMKK